MSAPSSLAVPSYVPAAYRGWVQQAAAGTDLPPAVVAAQINEESGFNPNATSPVGAEGIAQFMPGTWRSQGVPGSPYQPAAALQGYIRLMRSLVNQYGGDVRKALAAYNAGPGNLPAGYGYADTILSNAGHANLRVAGGAGAPASSSSAASSAPASSSSFGGLGGFLLRAVLTIGLLIAGAGLAWQGFNGLLGGAPGRGVKRTTTAAAVMLA